MRIQSLVGWILVSTAVGLGALACGSGGDAGAGSQAATPTMPGAAGSPQGQSGGPAADSTPTGDTMGGATPDTGSAPDSPVTSPSSDSTPGSNEPTVTPATPGSDTTATSPGAMEPSVSPSDPAMPGEPAVTPEPVATDVPMTPEPATTPEPAVAPEPAMTPEPNSPATPAGTGVAQSDTCPDITWPASNGSKNLGSGISVGSGEVYDGGMALHEGSLEDCTTGNQDTVEPLIDVADGGTVKNIVFGKNIGDGIHCNGSCTIENVWFPYVCDDAVSALGGGTVTIRNSGFKNARDKTIQHNGSGTVNLDTIYVETAGKLYRSCGEGCDNATRTANLKNIVAIGVDQIAGVGTNDTVTLQNICTYRSFSICDIYDQGTSDESTAGVNGSNEGPSDNCHFAASDVHALLDEVTGIPFETESLCGGPNAYKSGSTATSCVDGFDRCLKPCAPGGYGFKEIWCENGRYAEGDGAICALPTDPVVAQNLAQDRVMGATNMVNKNDNCSTEWDIGIDSSNNANYCVCVRKPGYYQVDNWLSWDCQRRWW